MVLRARTKDKVTMNHSVKSRHCFVATGHKKHERTCFAIRAYGIGLGGSVEANVLIGSKSNQCQSKETTLDCHPSPSVTGKEDCETPGERSSR